MASKVKSWLKAIKERKDKDKDNDHSRDQLPRRPRAPAPRGTVAFMVATGAMEPYEGRYVCPEDAISDLRTQIRAEEERSRQEATRAIVDPNQIFTRVDDPGAYPRPLTSRDIGYGLYRGRVRGRSATDGHLGIAASHHADQAPPQFVPAPLYRTHNPPHHQGEPRYGGYRDNNDFGAAVDMVRDMGFASASHPSQISSRLDPHPDNPLPNPPHDPWNLDYEAQHDRHDGSFILDFEPLDREEIRRQARERAREQSFESATTWDTLNTHRRCSDGGSSMIRHPDAREPQYGSDDELDYKPEPIDRDELRRMARERVRQQDEASTQGWNIPDECGRYPDDGMDRGRTLRRPDSPRPHPRYQPEPPMTVDGKPLAPLPQRPFSFSDGHPSQRISIVTRPRLEVMDYPMRHGEASGERYEPLRRIQTRTGEGAWNSHTPYDPYDEGAEGDDEQDDRRDQSWTRSPGDKYPEWYDPSIKQTRVIDSLGQRKRRGQTDSRRLAHRPEKGPGEKNADKVEDSGSDSPPAIENLEYDAQMKPRGLN